MFVPVLAALLTIAAQCGAADSAALEDLVSAHTLDELGKNKDGSGDVIAAVRYMIPVPIRVVVPVPQQEPYPYAYQDSEREPIIVVPVGATQGRYGPRWRPVGPPFLAVPAESTYPYTTAPERYYDGRRAYANTRVNPQRVRAAAVVRRTRSADEEELKAEEQDQGELTSDMSPKQVPAKGIHGVDNPLKASSKTHRTDFKSSDKESRPKRQVPVGGYYVRSGYARPARVIVPSRGQQQVVVAPVPMSSPQVIPVPVYVPVPVETI